MPTKVWAFFFVSSQSDKNKHPFDLMIHGSPQWRDNTQGMLSLTGVGKDTLLLQALVIQKRMETTFTEFLVQIK